MKTSEEQAVSKPGFKVPRGWQVALAGAGINFIIGVSYTWSIFAGGLSREFGWTQAEAAFPYTVFIFCYALAMVITGRIQDRFGPRLVVITGSLFLGSAFILSSFFITPFGVAASWGFFYGIGFACCYAAVTPAALKWFPPERQGFVTGVVVTTTGLSAFVMAPLVHLLVGQGVQRAFLFFGILILLVVFLLAQLINNPPQATAGMAIFAGPEAKPWHEIFRFPQFYMLWLMFCFTTGAGITFVTHMTRIVEVQVSFEKGYIMVALFAFFNAGGRLAAGFLSDLLGRSRAMTLIFAVMTLALVFMLNISSPLLFGIAISFIGLAYGGLFSLFPAAAVSFFGAENFGLNYGLIFTGLGAASIFPLIAGFLFELHGHFDGAFILLVAVCLVSLILSFFLQTPLVRANKMDV